jgi:hypothetical protein
LQALIDFSRKRGTMAAGEVFHIVLTNSLVIV